jgi:hypothetical protein
MKTTTIIPITLTLPERHALSDLVSSFLHDRSWEGVRAARYSIDLEATSQKVHRLAAIKGLAEGDQELAADIDVSALRAELVSWAAETVATVDEHDAEIAVVPAGQTDEIEALWRTSAVDYAHQCVCERIASQIDSAAPGLSDISITEEDAAELRWIADYRAGAAPTLSPEPTESANLALRAQAFRLCAELVGYAEARAIPADRVPGVLGVLRLGRSQAREYVATDEDDREAMSDSAAPDLASSIAKSRQHIARIEALLERLEGLPQAKPLMASGKKGAQGEAGTLATGAPSPNFGPAAAGSEMTIDLTTQTCAGVEVEVQGGGVS